MTHRPARSPGVEALLAHAVAALNGEHRTGQVAMAQAVAAALSGGDKRHLLVQAGTGTGKSLAYLVPAMWHVTARDDADDERRPVIVATATLALQRQLVERDLPRLVEVLSPLLPRRPTFAILKGRRNYLCRLRLGGSDQPDLLAGDLDVLPMDALPMDVAPARQKAGGAGVVAAGLPGTANVRQGTGESPEAPAAGFLAWSALGREVARITSWANETSTGDRDELVPGVSERAWGQFAVTARECVGASRCPHGSRCFSELARIRAGQADIVVTNHAMLAVDVLGDAPVLPEHDVVIVDEAHELVDRVTAAATAELGPAHLVRVANRLRTFASVAAGRLERAVGEFDAALRDVSVGRLIDLPERLVTVLSGIRDAAREGVSALLGEVTVDGRRAQARAAAEELFDTASRFLAGDSGDVRWLDRDDRGGSVLRAAPLDVAPLLRNAIFASRIAVLTSATLTVGGSFHPMIERLGLHHDVRTLDVGSPFSYQRQGILYVASHLPPPGRDGISADALEELVALMTAAGGRTLGLFSSMRAAQEAAAFARERVDFPVLCQGDDATAELIRRFAADAQTCLFGTLSLWQGVDVPGAACQLVVVDRIPFPRPDDPLMAARQQAVTEAGGNGFLQVAAGHAALLLAQGCGRLLRSPHDRGVVAVLDSRLATARYARFLRSSLPPFWYTTDRDLVCRSLRALSALSGSASSSAS
ncbi:MAG: ATP-dependent DNA helicase [Acidothermus cellulolyticus]|nr:ATP-dependent DNA helicase [Acidothermus cellulolyticus]